MWIKLRQHIHIVAGLVMVGLALNSAYGTSAVIKHYESIGVPHDIVASALFGGAIITIVSKSPAIFALGTLPYAIYMLTTLWVTFEHRGGYSTSIVYLFSYIQLVTLYDCKRNEYG